MEQLYSKIQDNFPFLEKEDIKLLMSISSIKNFEPGDILVDLGELNSNVHVVLKGLLRSYVITSSGEDRTVLISKEQMRAVAMNSFMNNGPSDLRIEALEPSKILIINSTKFQVLARTHPSLAQMEKNGMIMHIKDAYERLHLLTVLSPEERYLSFRDNYPDLIQRVPQMYLASYLGVTRESLSRIKARVLKKKL